MSDRLRTRLCLRGRHRREANEHQQPPAAACVPSTSQALLVIADDSLGSRDAKMWADWLPNPRASLIKSWQVVTETRGRG